MNETSTRFGATPVDWYQWEYELGLVQHLLPIVANPTAKPSALSSIKDPGKLPSVYNGNREMIGLTNWTTRVITSSIVAAWAKEPDYGIGLRLGVFAFDPIALDFDITDTAQAAAAEVAIEHLNLPIRRRGNSSKFLALVRLDGVIAKRRMKTEHGIIELLAKGQQCVVAGMHPSGARYEWDGGQTEHIPSISLQDLDALWAQLFTMFAIEGSTQDAISVKHETLKGAVSKDPFVQHLIDTDHVHRIDNATGRVDIRCFSEHDGGEGSISSTSYYPAHTGGYESGTFKCLHASCLSNRMSQPQIKAEYGYKDQSLFDAFDNLDEVSPQPVLPGNDFDDLDAPNPTIVKAVQSSFSSIQELRLLSTSGYHIKKVLPRAEMGVAYGASGTGKSFIIGDMMFAIARGVEWNGHRVKQGRVAYVCAEGKEGFPGRAVAYCEANNLDITDLGDIRVYNKVLNLLDYDNALQFAKDMVADGKFDLIVIDTLAQVTAGGDENSSKDMSLALSLAKGLHRATKATVLLVHHAGKDASKGARGWSGLRAACDFEMEVTREGHNRCARVTKMKDGADGAEFHFKLNEIAIGIDEDADIVTSCVVEFCDPADVLQDQTPKGKWDKIMWKIVNREIPIGEGLDRRYLVGAFFDSVTGPIPPEQDKRKRNGGTALDKLVEQGFLNYNGLHYFINSGLEVNA